MNETFENDLKDALGHLHDPAYQPPPALRRVLGNFPEKALIQAIAGLKPDADTPTHARVWRLYRLLYFRYVQEYTQVEVAQQLNISLRHLRREQQQAVRVLAQRLQQPPAPLPATTTPTTQPESWQSQVRQELVSLEQHAPGAVAEVQTAIDNALKMGQALISGRPIALRAHPVLPELVVDMHPSLLSQILVTAIEKLVQDMSAGEIWVTAGSAGDSINLIVHGEPVTAQTPPQSDLIREIVGRQNGACRVQHQNNYISFELELPSVRRIKVLVVDDNYDLVHWYRRYTAQTRFELTHLARGEAVFDTLAQLKPDIIVLDVMLPDTDGWELLSRLHESPGTRGTPVIVCSVVKREALAMALGAALYLPKPVHRQQFIEALEQALAWGSTITVKTEANFAPDG